MNYTNPLTCQANKTPAKRNAPWSKAPVAAAQPIKGGIAPTTDPTQVLAMDILFNGVYTPAYSKIFPAPRTATNGFKVETNTVVPKIPQVDAKINAWNGLFFLVFGSRFDIVVLKRQYSEKERD